MRLCICTSVVSMNNISMIALLYKMLECEKYVCKMQADQCPYFSYFSLLFDPAIPTFWGVMLSN